MPDRRSAIIAGILGIFGFRRRDTTRTRPGHNEDTTLSGTTTVTPKDGVATFTDLGINIELDVHIAGNKEKGRAKGVRFSMADLTMTIATLHLPVGEVGLLRSRRRFDAVLTSATHRYTCAGIQPLGGSLHSSDERYVVLQNVKCQCHSIDCAIVEKGQ